MEWIAGAGVGRRMVDGDCCGIRDEDDGGDLVGEDGRRRGKK
jgi:hypothetical protein